MNHAESLSTHGRRLLDRRSFLETAGLSTAGLALTSMLADDGVLADSARTVSGKDPIRPAVNPNNPYAARDAHFNVPAKQVLVIYCPGAVSHIDTFDYKPALSKLHGEATGASSRHFRRAIRKHCEAVLGFQTTRRVGQDGFGFASKPGQAS